MISTTEAPSTSTTFSGIYIASPLVRRVWFEADSDEQARVFCANYGFGYEGPRELPQLNASRASLAVNKKEAAQLLGGVSGRTVDRMLIRGELERLSNTRRVLITRSSIERHCRR